MNFVFNFCAGSPAPSLAFFAGSSGTKLELFSLSTAVRRNGTFGTTAHTPGGIAFDAARNQIYLTYANVGSILQTRLNGNRTIFTSSETGKLADNFSSCKNLRA